MRAKARPEGEKWIFSETLGIVKPLVGDIQISQCSLAYPSMALLLNQFLLCNMSTSQKRDFKWTSISVNQGFAARRHRDTGHVGPSMIASSASSVVASSTTGRTTTATPVSVTYHTLRP